MIFPIGDRTPNRFDAFLTYSLLDRRWPGLLVGSPVCKIPVLFVDNYGDVSVAEFA